MSELAKTDIRRQMLEAIHDSAVDAIVSIDELGIIETVNPATESLFGYSAGELIGQNITMLMPPSFHREHDDYIQRYLKTGVRKVIGIGREIVAQKKDGSEIPIHLAVSEVRLEGRRVFVGFVRDLSGLKQIEEQRATLGKIIEDSLNEVYIFDAVTLHFIQVNRGARENLGYSMAELAELTPLDIKPKYIREQFLSTIIRPLLAGEVDRQSFSTVHCRKDGSTYDVDVHLHLSTYLTKRVFVAIILDVTKRVEAERQVRQQQAELQADLQHLVETRTRELQQAQADLVRSEKFSTLGKVSGGIAHEIRNPLNAVKTSAYFLLNAKAPTEQKIKEHLQRIDRQVSIIDNVVTALSDVAKLPDGQLRPVTMKPIIREIIRSTSIPANIQVVVDFPDELPNVLADEHQAVIALRNLVRNARDAMPSGGTLTISADVQDDKVVFSVIDTGIGISSHDLQNVLEPLFTTKARGMGLGLSITKAIVEKNRGELAVESELGKGSKFSFALLRHQ